MPVDAATLETRFENVFAVGDVNYVRLADCMLLPKAGVFAEHQAQAVARIIASRIDGGSAGRLDGGGRCYLEVGAGAAAMADGDFLAANRRIDLKQPSIIWHWAKVAAEKYWLWHSY